MEEPVHIKTERQFLDAYEAHADVLFRFCYFKLSDREAAKDAVQNIFMRLWEYLSDGNRIDHMKAFLFTAAYNEVKDRWKKKKAVPMSALEEDDTGDDFDVPDDTQPSAFLQAEFMLALESFSLLSDEDRTLLQMRFIEDMRVTDMARELSMRENTVAVRINRALSKLRKRLNDSHA